MVGAQLAKFLPHSSKQHSTQESISKLIVSGLVSFYKSPHHGNE